MSDPKQQAKIQPRNESPESHAATDDLEPTDEMAAGITGGGDIGITKTTDKATADLSKNA